MLSRSIRNLALLIITASIPSLAAAQDERPRLKGTCLARPKQDRLAKHANPDDMQRFQGTWIAVSTGNPASEEIKKADARLVVEGERFTMMATQKPVMNGTIKLDPTKSPKHYDSRHADGKTLKGIYQFDGDKLRLCIAAPGVDRPTAFTKQPGDRLTIVTYERATTRLHPSSSLEYGELPGHVISAIRFEGNGPKPGENIKMKLLSRVGRPLDRQKLDGDLRILMRTQWFSDVQVFYEEVPRESRRAILTFVVNARQK